MNAAYCSQAQAWLEGRDCGSGSILGDSETLLQGAQP